MSAGVRVEGLSFSVEGRPILRDVTLEIRAGERTALVGPNGGGKTTLVKLILGVLTPDSGSIRFVDGSGAVIDRPRLGYLPQRPTLSPDAPVSAVDLVSLSLSPRGFVPPRGVVEEAGAALKRAGLEEERTGVPVGRLSGGQRQRVILARALAGSPPLLVLDEPDTALDAAGMRTLRRVLSEEVAAGRTVVYVTHASDAMGGADAVWNIDLTANEVV